MNHLRYEKENLMMNMKNYTFCHKSSKIELREGDVIMNNFSEDLKKVLLAGLGAVAVTAEKSKEVVEQLVKKGELTVEQGKVLNEELKRNVAEKLREPVNAEKISKDLEQVSDEELEVLKAKIEELQNAKDESK